MEGIMTAETAAAPNVVEVSGGSDDLICIAGAIEEEFEYDCESDDGILVGFSDGSLLTVAWTADGAWRINQRGGGKANYEKLHEGQPDSEEYSDLVRLTLPEGETFRWAVCGKAAVSW
jgi:hypothetical protein